MSHSTKESFKIKMRAVKVVKEWFKKNILTKKFKIVVIIHENVEVKIGSNPTSKLTLISGNLFIEIFF